MGGQSMMALFVFVKSLSELSAGNWPALRHEEACGLVKQILRQGETRLRLVAPAAESDALTGWVLNAPEQLPSEQYIG